MCPSRRDFLISSTAAAFTSSRSVGANDRVQLGFIGYGLMGAQHVETFKRQPDADLAWVRAHRPRQPLQRVSGLDARARQTLEETNVRQSLAYAREHLGPAA